jgi:hypothetical protein
LSGAQQDNDRFETLGAVELLGLDPAATLDQMLAERSDALGFQLILGVRAQFIQ